MNTQNEDYVDLGVLLADLWRGIRKFWFLMLLLPLLGIAGMTGYLKNGYVPLYASQATFTVTMTGSGMLNELNTVYGFYYDQNTAEHIGKTFPYILESDVFRTRLKEVLKTESINGSISVSVIENSNLVTLKTSGTEKDETMKILRAVMEVYPEIARYVIGENHFDLIDGPETSDAPVNTPNYLKGMAQGMLLGLAASLAVAMLYALTRKTIRTEKDMKRAISRPCLAILPETGRIPVITRLKKEDLQYSETVYSLQNRLDFLMKKDGHKVLLVTSTVPAEGKTPLSLNLAYAMAQRGKNVLLIDGDLRNPMLSRHIGISELKHTICDVLRGTVPLGEAVQYLDEFSVSFLGNRAKVRNSVAVIQSSIMKKLIAEARESADVVIIDTPPCGILADAGIYDCMLLTVRQDWISETKVMDAVLDLPGHGSKLIGCVLNMAKTGLAGYGYGYGGYSGYYHSKYK